MCGAVHMCCVPDCHASGLSPKLRYQVAFKYEVMLINEIEIDVWWTLPKFSNLDELESYVPYTSPACSGGSYCLYL